MLVAQDFPDRVAAVVAATPSSLVFGDLGSQETPGARRRVDPAWGPLPFASYSDFITHETNPGDAPGAVIPVQRIKGPILTTCGEQDIVWASCT